MGFEGFLPFEMMLPVADMMLHSGQASPIADNLSLAAVVLSDHAPPPPLAVTSSPLLDSTLTLPAVSTVAITDNFGDTAKF